MSSGQATPARSLRPPCGTEILTRDKESALLCCTLNSADLLLFTFSPPSTAFVNYRTIIQTEMSSDTVTGGSLNSGSVQADSPDHGKTFEEEKHLENVLSSATSTPNLVYNDNDEEPELHARTYFALTAMFFLNLVQVFALQGPPAVVRNDCEAYWAKI